MKALAIDSSGEILCVSARNEGDTVSCVYDIGTRQSETLVGAIDYALGKVGIETGQLDFAALCAGPGSFTSLRLSFAALKAINMAWGIPIYAVPTLETLAYPYLGLQGIVIPVLDARKGRFYAAVYEDGAETAHAGDYTPQEIIARITPLHEATCTSNSKSGDRGKAPTATGDMHCVDSNTSAVQPSDANASVGNSATGVSSGVCSSDAHKSIGVFAVGGGARLFKETTAPIVTFDITVLPIVPSALSLFDIASEYMKKGVNPMKDFDGPLYLRPCDAQLHLNHN